MSLSSCADPEQDRIQALLDLVAHAPTDELGKTLFAFERANPNSQELLIEMLSPLRSPTTDQNLVIQSTERSGEVILVRVSVPWESNHLRPVLVLMSDEGLKVVGFVTAFGDIIEHLSDKDDKNIGVLSEIWVLEQMSK